MNLLEAIHKRRAVRAYRDEPPSRQQLRNIIEAASWAPSAMNDQEWRFIVITDRALLDQIAKKARQWILGSAELNEHLRTILNDPHTHLLHHAPALVIIAAPSKHRWATENCALAAENLMLAAADLGLGSCWIGMIQEWLNSSEGRALVGLPAADRAMAPIVVGYPQGEIATVPRRNPVVVWIGDKERLVEDGEGIQSVGVPGLYGALIHP